MPSKRSKICEACVSDEARERTVRYIEARKRGLNNIEIAAQEGVKPNDIAKFFSRAYRYGLEVPRSPYFERGKKEAAK